MKVQLRKKKLKNGDHSLYLDIYYNGKRDYKFLSLYVVQPKTPVDRQSNKEILMLAESVRAKRQLDIQHGAYGFSRNNGQSDFIQYFEMLTKKREQTGINHNNWLCTYKHLKKFEQGRKPFAEITHGWLEDFKSYLLAQVSQNSAHTYFNKIKAALYQAKRDKIIIDNPAERVQSPKEIIARREFLTLEEIQKLAKIECRYPVLKKAFLFSVMTGLRWSDIQKLVWKEIRYSKENGYRIDFAQKKTKEHEYLPISEQARNLLGEAQDLEYLVFRGLKYSAYHNVALSQWVMKAGITKHITFHCARHSHATLLLTNGEDIYTVSKLLGHRNIKTTEIYAKIIDEKKRRAIDKLPNINLGNASTKDSN